MKKTLMVIGASGDVGSGIVAALLHQGHRVIGAARHPGRLASLAKSLAHPAEFVIVRGSLETDTSADALLADARAVAPEIDGVIVSVNTPRDPAPLLPRASDALAALVSGDLITHYTAARTFVPALRPNGIFLGIGGGSCDFILHDGVPQSVAQAGLRMLYRGLAYELQRHSVHIRELIVASIVNGATTRDRADPLWVTDAEIGAQVAAIVADPGAFPGPILRLARRDESGRPVFSSEQPTRVQGFR